MRQAARAPPLWLAPPGRMAANTGSSVIVLVTGSPMNAAVAREAPASICRRDTVVVVAVTVFPLP